jgi:hypothetical protein
VIIRKVGFIASSFVMEYENYLRLAKNLVPIWMLSEDL